MGYQVLINCAPDSNGPIGLPDFSHKHILPCKKEKKTLDLQIFSQIGKTMEKVTVSSKYYYEHIIVIFLCLHV